MQIVYISYRRSIEPNRSWNRGQLLCNEATSQFMVRTLNNSNSIPILCIDFVCLLFSQIIASNLLLVDEMMRAGMATLKGNA